MTSTTLRSATTSRARVSTFTLKLAMAVTGWLFALFAAVHMYGNLKAWFGADAYNGYAHWLHNALYPLLPRDGLLWIMRIVLAVALVVHVVASLVLYLRGRRARGRFRRRGHNRWAAATMPWTGLLLLAFLTFHILDLTLGIAGAAEYRAATADESFAYQNTVASMGRPLAGAAYLLAMLVLLVHLVHGLWSSATEFGLTGRRTRKAWKVIAYVLAIGITVGNLTLPIGVWTGLL
ncbi:succinate dehydrogenase cytochrome b subunit [Aestuariimicrobium ganziense]|uniref:succinate dehydrogenase cytochrome b subunit n=1 Tax=Aestuariimicrobium ganziense TaxID=2773677 RepID=UPI001942DEBA|nr:succinate dehydrogenase cytochrome b subunit [Aestuariimicrobium ganziense]